MANTELVRQSRGQQSLRVHACGPAGGATVVAARFDDLGVLQASATFEAAHPLADRRLVLAA
jgi:hypothetical protein